MRRKIITIIISAAAVLGLSLVVLPAPTIAAPADCSTVKGTEAVKCSACQAEEGAEWVGGKCTKTSSPDVDTTIHNIINTMLFVVGILAVIMIIWGGIRYVISRGNPEDTKSAKNTILYSVVGLVVSVVAFAIVQWVFTMLE
jgi:hypothetical protein